MPYCRKCGAQLPEETRFCPSCGVSVAEPQRMIRREKRRPSSTLPVVFVVLLVSAAIIFSLSFLPFRPVSISEQRNVPYRAEVDIVNLDFTVDIADVNVAFEELDGKLVDLRVSIAGVGPLVLPKLHDLSWNYNIANNALTVTSRIDTAPQTWPLYPISGLRVTCDLRIDPSMDVSLKVKTSVGKIVVNTKAGVVINSLNLETTTGGLEVNLVGNVTLNGNVSVKTTTGGVEFLWYNVNAKNDVQIDLKTTTGGVEVDFTQDGRLLEDVTLKAEATTGGVDLAVDIQHSLGAKIESSTNLGRINVLRKVGFSGTDSLLKSGNYPASRNLNISLKTTVCGINIDAVQSP